MGFKRLPGEGRGFVQALFYPSCYILVEEIGGPRAVLGGWGQGFFHHEDTFFGEVPATCLLWGQHRDGAVCRAFSVPFLPAHHRAPPCSTTGTASNWTAWDGEGHSSGPAVQPGDTFMSLSRAATSRLPPAAPDLPCLASAAPFRGEWLIFSL